VTHDQRRDPPEPDTTPAAERLTRQRLRLELLLAALGPIPISPVERASLMRIATQDDTTVVTLAALIDRAQRSTETRRSGAP
jgi:hypothetical protein